MRWLFNKPIKFCKRRRVCCRKNCLITPINKMIVLFHPFEFIMCHKREKSGHETWYEFDRLNWLGGLGSCDLILEVRLRNIKWKE